MTTDEVLRRIQEDPDFVYLKRFDYSLDKVVQRYPDGAPTRVIAQALMLTEEDVEDMYPQIVAKLQAIMGIEE